MKIKNNFEHIIITRFNLIIKFPGKNKTEKERHEWLKDRIKKFEPCFRSIKNQTNNNFKWFIYLDNKTPSDIKKNLEELTTSENRVKLIYMEKTNKNTNFCYDLQRDFTNKLTGKQYLITTRLDSDDILFPEFVELIQSNFKTQNNYAINITRGIIYDKTKNKKYQVLDFSNPFITLIEDTTKGIKTVFQMEHPLVRFTFLTKQIYNKLGWIQMVHDNNLCNKTQLKHKIMNLVLSIFTFRKTKKKIQQTTLNI